jgi:ribosomal protein L37AE/L43A
MTDYLSTSEAGRLAELETVIERGLLTFIEVGSALMEIRNSRLYRQMYNTFEEYCQQRWDLRRSRTYQLMDAAEVVENLKSSTIVELSNANIPLPVNEAQARPLAKLEVEMQRQAWQRAVETAPQGRITARHVETVVREIQEAQVEPDSFACPRCGQRAVQLNEGVICLNETCQTSWATVAEFEAEAGGSYVDETELLRTHLKTELIKLINRLPPEQLKEFAAWLAEAKQKLAAVVN